MPSNTNNLGLYKKDPATDGNDTFDITSMLNDNWDKIDTQLGAQITASPGTTQLNLGSGLQVVNVAKSSPYNVLNIIGRTLVNLLGRDGNCEDVSKFTAYTNSALSLDAINKNYGSNSIKVATTGTYIGISRIVNLSTNSYYIAAAEITNSNVPSGINVQLNGVNSSSSLVGTGTAWVRVSTSGTITDSTLYFYRNNSATSSTTFSIDGIRLYQITQAEYNALATMTAAQIAAKYPYVDDVKHVNAPYVIKYGENLAPDFSQWRQILPSASTASINSPFSLTLTSTSNSSETIAYINNVYGQVQIVPGQIYTWTIGGTAGSYTRIALLDSSGNVVRRITTALTPSGTSTTFTAASNEVMFAVNLTNSSNTTGVSAPADTTSGTFTFTNPMLNLGSTAKTFKPRNDDQLFFPNTQLASSVDGTVYDQIYHKEGKWWRENRFVRDMVLDGSLAWVYDGTATGYKEANVPFSGHVVASGTLSKYDGKILVNNTLFATGADSFYLNATNLYVRISSADSGWGDSYTPTAQEIQAYFYGWRIFQEGQSASTSLYTSGNKWWAQRVGDIGTISGTTTSVLPTTPSGFTPYKLTYQLATPTFEEIQVEGGMTVHEGLNQIEVGTGVIVREKANPSLNTGIGFAAINVKGSPNYSNSCALKNRTARINAIYKNGTLDGRWTVKVLGGNGNFYADIPAANYDPTATYEVTYLALDQYLLSSSVQTINGEYAGIIKTVVDTLSTNQADAEARISAAENLARQLYQVPRQTVADTTYYVDGTNGADNNDGSARHPLKTIQAAINCIPQVVNHNYYVNVADGTYDEVVNINGFSGYGRIDITGNIATPTNCNIKSFSALSVTIRCFVQGFNATDTTVDSFTMNKCIGTNIQNCSSTAASASTNGFNANWSIGAVISCTFSNKGSAIFAANSSVIQSNTNSGTGNNVGLMALGAIIIKNNLVQPSGTTVESSSNGGQIIHSNGVINPWGDNTRDSRSRVYVSNNATQNLTASIATKLLYQSITIDNLTEFSFSKFTAKDTRATYDVKGLVSFNSGMSATALCNIVLYKNGAAYKTLRADNGTAAGTPSIAFAGIADAGAGDYLEIYVTTSAGTVVGLNTTLEITRIA